MTVSCWRSNIHRHCEQSDESARSVLNVSIVPLCSHELLIERRHSEAQSLCRSPSVKLKMRPFVKTIGLLLTAETLQTKVTSASISPSDWHNHAVLYPLITSPPSVIRISDALSREGPWASMRGWSQFVVLSENISKTVGRIAAADVHAPSGKVLIALLMLWLLPAPTRGGRSAEVQPECLI